MKRLEIISIDGVKEELTQYKQCNKKEYLVLATVYVRISNSINRGIGLNRHQYKWGGEVFSV